MKKILSLFLVLIMLVTAIPMASFASNLLCDTIGHDYDWIIVKEATCTQTGTKTQKCPRGGCGVTGKTEIIDLIPHTDEKSDNICDICGAKITLDVNTYKVGDIIQFGSYPQSEVKDEALIAELNAIAPEWDDWTSYGYYSGNGESGSMVQGDWMRYVDIKHDGERYRGVKFTSYRPYWPSDTLKYQTFQYTNGYYTNIIYWFKFESVDWRVLDPYIGLVMCENVIDSQPFNNTNYDNPDAHNEKDGYKYATFSDKEYKYLASDYVGSSIRQWLNKDFFETAFDDGERKEIATTCIDNNGTYTLLGYIGYEKLDGIKAYDKIFLLSQNEVVNHDYGFSSNSIATDEARRTKGSDYAKSQGLLEGESLDEYGNFIGNYPTWLLRTPGAESGACCVVYGNGQAYWSLEGVGTSYHGIRPALCLNDITKMHKHSYSSVISEQPTHFKEGIISYSCMCGNDYIEYIPKLEKHEFKEIVTPPTCTKDGYTTYSCLCGYKYDGEFEKSLGHSYESKVITPATHLKEGVEIFTCHCGDTYTKSIPTIAHTYTSSVTTQPTHLDEGVRTYICECNDTYTESIPKLEEHNHIPTVTAPTCTTKGYTTYTCECGDSYVDDYVNAVNHKDDNGDYKCDYNCGYEFEKPAPEVSEEPKAELNFFQKIIQWFKDLFAKLFGWLK